MFAAYETTRNYDQPQETLQVIMEEAVDRYLSLHHTAFPVTRQGLSIVLKIQKSYRSSGELLTVSIQNSSFYITSKCIKESSPLIAWGKNRDNVLALASCISDASQELFYSAA